MLRLFSLKHEFASESNKFFNPTDTATSQTMQLNLTMDRFPFPFRGRTIQITQIDLFLKFKDAYPPTYGLDATSTPQGDYAKGKSPLALHIQSQAASSYKVTLQGDSSLSGIPHGRTSVSDQLGVCTVQAYDTDPAGATPMISVPWQHLQALR